MGNMMSITSMFLVSATAQIVGFYLLPLTKGLTQPLPTVGIAAAFSLGIAIMARLSAAGINLSFFMPLMAAIVPLGAIAVGVLVFGEPASVVKAGVLIAACLLIGVASFL